MFSFIALFTFALLCISCYFCARSKNSRNPCGPWPDEATWTALRRCCAVEGWNLVICPGEYSFQGMWALSRSQAQFPTLIRSATTDTIDRKQPNAIYAAPESAIFRHGKHFRLRFFVSCQYECCVEFVKSECWVDVCRGARIEFWKLPLKKKRSSQTPIKNENGVSAFDSL